MILALLRMKMERVEPYAKEVALARMTLGYHIRFLNDDAYESWLVDLPTIGHPLSGRRIQLSYVEHRTLGDRYRYAYQQWLDGK